MESAIVYEFYTFLVSEATCSLMGKTVYNCELLSNQRKIQGLRKPCRTDTFTTTDNPKHTSSGCIGVFT
jgi:hypothetical protein